MDDCVLYIFAHKVRHAVDGRLNIAGYAANLKRVSARVSTPGKHLQCHSSSGFINRAKHAGLQCGKPGIYRVITDFQSVISSTESPSLRVHSR